MQSICYLLNSISVSCSPEEFINGDEGLAISVELDDATWEADFMDNLGSVQDAANADTIRRFHCNRKRGLIGRGN